MVRLLAESVSQRSILLAAAATLAGGAIAITEWATDALDEPALTIGPTPFVVTPPSNTRPATVELHVKMRDGATLSAASARPMFDDVVNAALAPTANTGPLPVMPSTATRAFSGETEDRSRWLLVDVPSGEADAIAAALAADPTVEYAFVAPEVSLATVPPTVDFEHLDLDDLALVGPRDDDACPITTPSFESYQGYVGAAPHGIDAPAAWRRGIRGQGVWFADVEGGWNAKHEDLPGDRISHVHGRQIDERGWREHGTAVLGEVVGRDNAKGVVGLAPDVERVFTSSIGGTTVAAALDKAARALRPGDVLLIELQTSGPRGRWIPVEFYPDTFEVIQAATRRGIVIIEAAGNGGENLEHKVYEGRFDPKVRDSGAIMVGAGGPPREGYVDRQRLDFSNYGARVDVQGWGRKVATLDYGDLQSCDERRDRHYTNEFSGTSSASPIVAGAAVLLESAARAKDGKPIEPSALRKILRETGSPQVGGDREHIGPRPDLARALRRL